jgi:hypothetical protein
MNDSKGKVIHDKTHKEMTGDHYIEFHVKDFAGLFPVCAIIEFALAPSGTSKDKRMTQYMRCILALFGEILLVDKKATIAPIKITNDTTKDLITGKSNIPSNSTKLGKWQMMSGGSWVFNKANSNVYARFCLKSTVPVEDMATQVSFKFSCFGGSKVYKKQNQAMETESPIMLLFVRNSTNPLSVSSDITQMLETS